MEIKSTNEGSTHYRLLIQLTIDIQQEALTHCRTSQQSILQEM